MLCPPRFATQRTPGRKTHGGRVARVSEALGMPFMPWQQMVADVAGEVMPDTGKLAYREVRITVPRQSGKTTLILPTLVYRCLGAFGDRQRVIYTAQDRNKARKKFETEHVELLERSPLRGMFAKHMSNGNERITWPSTGSQHGIDAVSETSGHGDTLDVGVIDEAFARTDWGVEGAMMPAMSTRKSAQLYVVSTAGTARSVYLRSKVDDGRARTIAGQTKGIAYFEWSCPDGEDVNDPALWPSFMPALGLTIDVDAVEAARESMSARPGEFARAYGNMWPDARAVIQAVPAEAWALCADTTAVIPQGERVAWAVETAADRAWSAIAAAGYTDDGRELVEVIELRSGPGRWLLPRLIDLASKAGHWTVCVDANGPAGSMIPDLEDAGFTVVKASQQDKAKACGAFLEAAISTDDNGLADRLVHRDQDELNDALAGADKQNIGDVWLWSRGQSLTDISALYACTLARWALTVMGEPWRDVLGSIG